MTTFRKQWERDRDAAYDAADAEYDRACKAAKTDEESDAAYAKYQAAHEAVGERFDRIWDAKQKVARERKEAAPPVVTVSPQQAAARVGLAMRDFWALVRSGKYPAPRTDNGMYDRDTIDRLPRPKVQRRPARRAVPDNVLTQIWKF